MDILFRHILLAVVVGLVLYVGVVSLPVAVGVVVVITLVTLLVSLWRNDLISGWLSDAEWVTPEEFGRRSPASMAIIEEVAAEYTNPDDLPMALVKTALGIVTSVDDPELHRATRNIGIKGFIHLGSYAGAVPTLLGAVVLVVRSFSSELAPPTVRRSPGEPPAVPAANPTLFDRWPDRLGMTVRHDGLTLDWLGYATLRIEHEDTVVYFDPGRYGTLTGEWEPDTPGVGHPPARDYRAEDGDVVCVTHIHHYDDDGIERVAREDATVVAFEGIDVTDSDRDLTPGADLPYEVVEVGMEDERVVDGVPVMTVPAYNHPDGRNVRADGTPIHPEGIGCGFLVEVGGTTVFWTGDTDVLDGHEELDASLFVPSIAQSFTMNRHEAADLAERMDPDLVVPIHYNTFEALEADSAAFAADVAGRGVPVVLDER